MFDIDLSRLLYSVPAIILCLTFHEWAHGFVAYKFGDPTAKMAGRLTLNPLKHLDPLGTLMLIFARFGWAKPVPVNPYNFEGDRRSKMTVVAMAGPLANLLFAVVATVFLYLIVDYAPYNRFFAYLYNLTSELVWINVSLAIFNLMPIPPLDGSKILGGFLPAKWEAVYYRIERYGFLILFIFILTGLSGKILTPLVYGMYNLIVTVIGKIPFL